MSITTVLDPLFVPPGPDKLRLRLFFFGIGVLIVLLMRALFALALIAAPVVP